MPNWLRVLDAENPVILNAVDAMKRFTAKQKKNVEINIDTVFSGSPYFQSLVRTEVIEDGNIERFEIVPHDDLYYRVLSDLAGTAITDKASLMAYMAKASTAIREYDKLRDAIQEMQATGYGVVRPNWESFELDEPQLYRSGKNFGVKLRATGRSIHLVAVDVTCEVAPIIGEQQQSEEMLKFLVGEYAVNKQTVWETPIFGRSLESIVREDIEQKATSMPATARGRMQKTLTRIVNNGKGGVICILL